MPGFGSLEKSPYISLILGVIFISVAVVYTCTGKVWVRFNGWVYRAKEPRAFWREVTGYYFVGVCFVVVFLFLVGARPN